MKDQGSCKVGAMVFSSAMCLYRVMATRPTLTPESFEQLELPPVPEVALHGHRSLPPDQRMARVRAEEPTWQEFRALAKEKGRSVADYLGWLVQKELNRAKRSSARRALRVEESHQDEVDEA